MSVYFESDNDKKDKNQKIGGIQHLINSFLSFFIFLSFYNIVNPIMFINFFSFLTLSGYKDVYQRLFWQARCRKCVSKQHCTGPCAYLIGEIWSGLSTRWKLHLFVQRRHDVTLILSDSSKMFFKHIINFRDKQLK